MNELSLDLKPPRPPKSRRRRSRSQDQTQQELDPTLLQSLGSTALGLAGAAGNVLDLPGSSVRDVLAGRNPFDQWIPGNWTSDENRISGRDLLRQHGMIGKKDTWGNFAGGLAAEIATDPFTLLGFSALGKTAQGVSKVKEGKNLAKGLGAGIRAGDRALAAGKVPFGPHWSAGTGETAAKIGDALDKTWEGVRGTGVGRLVATGLHAPSMGRKEREVQRAAEEIVYPERMRGRKNAKTTQLDFAAGLEKHGVTDADAVRREIEGVEGYNQLPDEFKDRVWELFDQTRFLDAYYGRGGKKLQDRYVRFAPRRKTISKNQSVIQRGGRLMEGKGPSDVGRIPLYKDWKEGTAGVKDFFKDEDLKSFVNAFDSRFSPSMSAKDARKLEKKTLEGMTQHIEQTYGDKVDQIIKVKEPKIVSGFGLEGIDETDEARKILSDYYVGLRDIKRIKNKELRAAERYGHEAEYGNRFANLVEGTPHDELDYGLPREFADSIWESMKKSYRDRAPILAKKFFKASDETTTHGLYGNHPAVDLYTDMVHRSDKIAAIKGMNSVMSNYLPQKFKNGVAKYDPNFDLSQMDEWQAFDVKGMRTRDPNAMTFSQVFKKLKLNPKISAGVLLRENNTEVTADAMQTVLNTKIPAKVADDLTGFFEKRTLTNAEGMIGKFHNAFINLFKAGNLSHPARHSRDLMGGMLQSKIHGIAGIRDYWDALKLYLGKPIKGLSQDPEIRKWVDKNGIDINDKNATKAVSYLFAENGPGDVFKHTDVAGGTIASPKGVIEDVLKVVPGREKSTIPGNVKSVLKSLAGRDGESTWNPFKAKFRGVKESDKTTFAPFVASEKASEFTDTMNRLAPFIALKRKGMSSADAMKRINDVQVNYDPQTFTEFEKVLKKIFPFYSYTSRMVKHTAKELATKPGGGLAQVVRLENAARDRSGTTPDHIADTAAIPDPFFQSKDGTKQYLTGLGLMHDDALQFFNPSLSGLLSEGASRLNPLLQKPLEYATGRSLFFKEPGGGRPLEDLDPTIGRILANVTGQEDAVRYPGDWAVEGANSLAPWSRATTTLRQLTDSRKSWQAKALNAVSGLKISTVSPQQQERTLRRKLEESARKLGARTFEQIYFPKDKTYTGQAKERVEAYQKLINALSKKAKTRAKDKVKDKKVK